MIENLIGYRLIEIDNSGFKVEKDGNVRTFEFDEDYGDCCGYNEVTANLLVSEEDLAKNPIITEVNYDNPQKMRNYAYCEQIVITFMGESRPIAEINSESGSGSGWNYGAHAWVVCKETGETEVLTEW